MARSPGESRRRPCRARLARLIRWAIVASGTKKASAISRVVRPPTARSVSATWEAAARPGWQQQKSRNSVSSPSSGPAPPTRARPPPPRLGVRRLLAAVTGGLAAAGVDEPPGGDRRQPRARVARRVLGPRSHRLQQRLLERVLGGVEVLAPPDQAREHPRDEGAQRALVQPSCRLVDQRRVDHAGSDLAPVMTSRTSIHSYSGSPPGPGSEE